MIGLIAALVTIFCNHRLTYWREREARRVAACQKFRNTILNELVGLYPIPTNWPQQRGIVTVLEAKFPMLQAAVTDFAYTLPFRKRFFFLRAWKIYSLGKNWQGKKDQNYSQYHPTKIEEWNGKQFKAIHDSTITYQSSFKKNIKRLLSYAK